MFIYHKSRRTAFISASRYFLAGRAAHKNKHIYLGFHFLKVNQVLPHKIKNPVLDRSISTVEKDCIHESVSTIEGSGRGRIHRGKGVSIVAYLPQVVLIVHKMKKHGHKNMSMVGRTPQLVQHTLVLNNMCVNNLYNQKNIR